jgi:hypothetical protein
MNCMSGGRELGVTEKKPKLQLNVISLEQIIIITSAEVIF